METTTTNFRSTQPINAGPEPPLSDDDDDLPNVTRSTSRLSNDDGPSQDHRGQEAHGYPGRSRGRNKGRAPRFFRPWLYLANRLSRRSWARIPDSDPNGDTDLTYEEAGGRSEKRHETFLSIFIGMMLSSWLNWLLVFVPIGLLTYIFKMNPILVFITNVIAIIPLSSLLTEATEKIASDAGDTIGALLNISLGNLVELILFIVALVNNHIRIVQASILGSILVNLLPILGSALLASSVRNHEPVINTAETQLLSCLLFVSVFVFLMPTAFDYTFDHEGAEKAILKMSRISALLVLMIYLLYFVHELRSRPKSNKSIPGASGADETDVANFQGQGSDYQMQTLRSGLPGLQPVQRTIRFADQDTTSPSKMIYSNEPESFAGPSMGPIMEETSEERPQSSHEMGSHSRPASSYGHRPRKRSRSGSLNSLLGLSREIIPVAGAERIGMMRSGLTNILRDSRTSMESVILHHELPPANRSTGDKVVSVFVLILTSALMSMCAEFLVSTIDDVTHQGGLSEALIGLIILPIVGNIAEYVTVVTVATRDKLDLAIAVAVGSSIQIALCVTPLTIIAGWILNRNLALTFNFFEMATLLGTVLLVNLLILNDAGGNSRTNGLRGALVCSCGIHSLGAYLSPSEKE